MARNARILSRFGLNNARYLGLVPGHKVQAHSYHPVHRVGPQGYLQFEIVVELLQQRPVRLVAGRKDSPEMMFRGGVTLVLEADGTVRYAVHKWLDNEARVERQREFLSDLGATLPDSAYVPPRTTRRRIGRRVAELLHDQRVNFSLVHRGY